MPDEFELILAAFVLMPVLALKMLREFELIPEKLVPMLDAFVLMLAAFVLMPALALKMLTEFESIPD